MSLSTVPRKRALVPIPCKNQGCAGTQIQALKLTIFIPELRIEPDWT